MTQEMIPIFFNVLIRGLVGFCMLMFFIGSTYEIIMNLKTYRRGNYKGDITKDLVGLGVFWLFSLTVFTACWLGVFL